MSKELKYEYSNGVHTWRHPDGTIFCAASGTTKEDTPCFPTAKQYVDPEPSPPSPSPSPVLTFASPPTLTQVPTPAQSGDLFSFLVMVVAIVGTVVFGVVLTYRFSPVSATEPYEPDERNPQGSGRSGHERSNIVHLPLSERSGERSGSEIDSEPAFDEGSSLPNKSYAQMPLQAFREQVPSGTIDPRCLTLADRREAAKQIIWDFYRLHGVSNKEKLAWVITGATKGGGQAWSLTSQFLSDVCPVLFQWGYTPSQKRLRGE